MNRKQYLFNVIDSLKNSEYYFSKFGLEIGDIEQSPRSLSTYVCIKEGGESKFKIRVSDHYLPSWCTMPLFVYDEFISKNGKFDITFMEILAFKKHIDYYKDNFDYEPENIYVSRVKNNKIVSEVLFTDKADFILYAKQTFGMNDFYMFEDCLNTSLQDLEGNLYQINLR